MKQLKGKISLRFDRDRGMTIELEDVNSRIEFLEIAVSKEDVAAVMSNLACVDCEFKLRAEELVGKYHHHKRFEFEMPDGATYDNRKQLAYDAAKRVCPEGWKPDNYFSSQDSFFTKNGKEFARCIIRCYTDSPNLEG